LKEIVMWSGRYKDLWYQKDYHPRLEKLEDRTSPGSIMGTPGDFFGAGLAPPEVLGQSMEQESSVKKPFDFSQEQAPAPFSGVSSTEVDVIAAALTTAGQRPSETQQPTTQHSTGYSNQLEMVRQHGEKAANVWYVSGWGQHGDPLSFFDTLKSRAPGATNFRTITNYVQTQSITGYLYKDHARAYVYTPGARGEQDLIHDVRTGPAFTPYAVVTYATNLLETNVAGAHFISSAQAKANITAVTATTVTWNANGTTYGVSKAGTGQANASEHGLANVHIIDPATYLGLTEGETFTLDMSPNGEWDVQFPDQMAATATFTGFFGSDVDGLGNLANWTITETSVDGNAIDFNVTFTSNAALGLDDGQISQSILNGFSTDGSGQVTYNGPPTISVTMPIPAGYSFGHDSVELSSGWEATLDAHGLLTPECSEHQPDVPSQCVPGAIH
jgi:hypothetical protein